MDEETPSFEVAAERLRRFLRDQGWPTEIVWRRPEDVVVLPRRPISVRRRRSRAAAAWAAGTFEAGRRKGIGVALEVHCELTGRACATVLWIDDASKAADRWIPARGLRLYVAIPRVEGRSLGLLRWLLACRQRGAFYPGL